MAASSAQYVIDVAVSMPQGEATAEQLDTLSKKLLASGASADDFHDAIAQASNALNAAKAASLSANAALGAGNAAYKGLEQAALQASKAQEKAAKLGVVPPGIASDAAAASKAVNDYAVKLAALEAHATAAAADEAKLATQLKQVQQASSLGAKTMADQTKATALARKIVGDLKSGFAELGGPIGFIGAKSAAAKDSFMKLSEQFGAGNASALIAATGALALAAAIAVVTVALVAGALAVAGWAVGLADANRSAGLHQEALEQLDPKYKAIAGSLDDLTYDTGQTTAQLDALTKSLIDAKVPASQLPDALRAAALAESALGQGGAQQFIDQIKAGTLSVNKFADTAEAKFGGVVAKQMQGLGAQSARLKNEMGQVFGGLNIDPVLKGFARLVALFDDSTAAGSAIKTLFTGLFQPLIDTADKASIVIEAFVLGFLIGLTKLYIAVKPAIKAVSEFFGFHDASLASTLALVTKAAEYIAPVFAVVVASFGAVVLAIGVAIAAVTAIQVAILALPYAIGAAAIALGGVFLNAWHSVTAFLSGIDLATVGHDIITGLVNGLLATGPAVLNAIGGIVTGAIDSAKHLLGIASPSKVFGEIGVNTGEGFTRGVDATADTAQASVAALVAPPDPAGQSAMAQQTAQQSPRAFGGGSSDAGGGGSSTSSSKSISITGPFIFQGVQGAEDAESRFGELLTRILEGDATQLGATPVPA